VPQQLVHRLSGSADVDGENLFVLLHVRYEASLRTGH
jgi:hypothetical protein